MDPSMLAGLLGPPPSADRSNDLMAGILSAVADHLRGAPADSAAHEAGEPPAFEKKEESSAAKKSPSKKSPESKSSGAKKPPSKKASSK